MATHVNPSCFPHYLTFLVARDGLANLVVMCFEIQCFAVDERFSEDTACIWGGIVTLLSSEHGIANSNFS